MPKGWKKDPYWCVYYKTLREERMVREFQRLQLEVQMLAVQNEHHRFLIQQATEEAHGIHAH